MSDNLCEFFCNMASKYMNYHKLCFLFLDDQVCFRSTTFTIMSNIVRHSYTTDDILSEFVPRSQSSCASACLSDWQCQGYNYKTDLCRLFNKKSTDAELQSDSEWLYFEKNNEELQSC